MSLRAIREAVLCAAAILLLLAQPAAADTGFFVGDSIAQGLAGTLKKPSAARQSVSMMRDTISGQFTRTPANAIVLMSLGANDAANPVQGMKPFIERVIGVAAKSGRRVVWIGPPCVLKSYDARAKELDAYLAATLQATAIQYVSLRDDKICNRRLRTSDGVHFTVEGYQYLWSKIRRDAAFAALVD